MTEMFVRIRRTALAIVLSLLMLSSVALPTVGFEHAPPVALIEGQVTATVGETVTYDGSGSSDPDGDEVAYSWVVTTAGPTTDATSTLLSESFEAGSLAAAGWSHEPMGSDAGAGVNAKTAGTGSYAAYHSGDAGAIVSPTLDAGDATALDISYWVQVGDDSFSENPDGGTGEDLIVEYLDDAGNWVEVDRFEDTLDSGSVHTRSVSISSTDALHSSFALRFHQEGGSVKGGDFWHVDDVLVTATTTGGQATTTVATGSEETLDVVFPDPGDYTVSLTVTDPHGGTDTASTTVAVDAVEQVPPTATITGPTSATAGGSVTFDGSGSEDPNGDTITYDWVVTTDVQTDTGTATLLSTSFESGSLTAAGWSHSPMGPDAGAGVNAKTSGSGSFSAYHSGDAGAIVSPTLDAGDATALDVSYWVQVGDDSFSENPDGGTGEDLIVEYRTPDGTWVEVDRFEDTLDSGSVHTRSVSLTSSDALHASFALRFHQEGGSAKGGDFWHVDDVLVTATGGQTTTTVATGSEETLDVVFPDPGDYTVSLTVTDSAGGSDTASIAVSVTGDDPQPAPNAAPDAVLDAPTTATIDEVLTFDASGSSDPDGDPLIHDWNLGDGTFATGQTVAHAYATPGTYTVTLTVTDPAGLSDTTSAAVVVVDSDGNDPPVAVIAGSTLVEAGVPVTFDGRDTTDPDGDPLTYEWLVTNAGDGDGGPRTLLDAGFEERLLSAAGWTHDPIGPDAAGDVDTRTAATGSYSAYHSGDEGALVSPTLDTDGVTAVTVSYWVQVGDDSFSEDPDAGTGEDLIVEYLDDAGNWVEIDRFEDSLADGSVHTRSVSLTSSDAFHSSFAVRFHQEGGSVKGGDFWHVDDVLVTVTGGTPTVATGSGDTLTVSFPSPGDYTVSLAVTDPDGAEDTTDVPVTVTEPNGVPVAALSGPTQATVGQPLSFDGTGSTDPDGDSLTYDWNLGDGTTVFDGAAAVDHSYASSGTYTVVLTVTDSHGESDTATQEVQVTDPDGNDPPTALISAPTVTTTGQAVTLDASKSTDPDGDGLTYTWDFGDGTTADGVAVDHTYSTAASYTVTLTVTDTAGLSSTETRELRVLDEVAGDLRRWHTVTLSFVGPETSETATPNPFTDYRLDVTFVGPSGQAYLVPGYYAADGDAGNTGAAAGPIWRAHLAPDEAGEWTYTASFVTGSGVTTGGGGTPTAFDGATGSFVVDPVSGTGPDIRQRGHLEYAGGHYYQFAGTGEYYLKTGANSPENFLAYEGFDATYDLDGTFLHSYGPHVADWAPGDPTWGDGRGKGIVGGVNYLASEGVNSQHLLTYTAGGGDANDVWPWVTPDERTRYDVSKLDQWEVVLEHLNRKGLVIHLATQESENDQVLDGGSLGPTRKLYYRELVARFGHHPGLVWNLGEENTNTPSQRTQFAAHFRELDPYESPIVISSYPGRGLQRPVYDPFLGDPNFEGPSLQTNRTLEDTSKDIVYWRKTSTDAGRPWVIMADEIGEYRCGIPEDGERCLGVSQADHVRISLWGSLLAGAGGVEWYFGYRTDHDDLDLEDFRSRDGWWDYSRYARTFFEGLPFTEMEPADDVLQGVSGHGFAKAGDTYVLYVAGDATGAEVVLPDGSYTRSWYDPFTGEYVGSETTLVASGGTPVSLGAPPIAGDVVVLLEVHPEPTDGGSG